MHCKVLLWHRTTDDSRNSAIRYSLMYLSSLTAKAVEQYFFVFWGIRIERMVVGG